MISKNLNFRHNDDKTFKPKPKHHSKPTTCQICGLYISHKTNLIRHMKRYHDDSLPLSCTQCSYRFSSEARLKTHEFKDHTENSNDTVALDIARHLNEARREGDKTICNDCGEACDNEESLIEHIQAAHSHSTTASFSHPGSFPCEYCDHKATMRHNLLRHYRRVHSDELKYECKICHVKFKTQQYLYRHEVRSHEREDSDESKAAVTSTGEQADQICRFCKQTFNGSKYRFERHLITFHEDAHERVLQCDICSKKFIYMQSLKFHMDVHRKRAREEKLPFKCGQCCRGFVDEMLLERHV